MFQIFEWGVESGEKYMTFENDCIQFFRTYFIGSKVCSQDCIFEQSPIGLQDEFLPRTVNYLCMQTYC